MTPEDTLALLERVLQEGRGEVSCEFLDLAPRGAVRWSCDISVYRGEGGDLLGMGTGTTLIEAVDDALTDLAESS